MKVQARVVGPDSLQISEGSSPIWNDYSRHLLAEGDSWFSMAALPGGNLLQELWLERSTLIVNCAYPGDTLTHMVEWRQNVPFVNLLARRNFAYKWDAILLSAGGNDLIDAALASPGILKGLGGGTPGGAADFIEEANFAVFEAYLRANFQALVALRDDRESPNQGIPIVIHSYDFPTPRPAPARLIGTLGVFGPWLARAFSDHRVPPAHWQAVSDELLRRLAAILNSLSLANVTVVDTLGTLDRAIAGSTGDSGDWLNEIHPNRRGRKKLAEKWAAVVEEL